MFLFFIVLLSTGPRCILSLAGVAQTPLAPLSSSPHSEEYPVVNNSYIVVFKDETPEEVQQIHLQFLQAVVDLHPLQDGSENGVQAVYNYAVKGYAGKFSPNTLYEIRSRPEVNYVQENRVMKAQKMATQRAAPWALGRISHRASARGEQIYTYDERAGLGTCSYVIDTGIDVNHPELRRNAVWGTNVAGGGNNDVKGHGTHVAGIMGSNTFGVAKRTRLIAVKALGDDGRGNSQFTISAIEFVIRDKQTRKGCVKGSVINMSLAGPVDRAVSDATHKATRYGIHTVVAAGNDGQDSCRYSPASTPSAITVGATDIGDNMWQQSNWGTCVDILAPGAQIMSTVPNGRTEPMTGTSMASPVVAGVVAYLLSLHPDTAPRQFTAELGSEWDDNEEPMGPPPFLSDLAYQIATQKTEPWTADAMQAFLIQISTQNVIKNMKPSTFNRLAFNNGPP